MTGSTHIASDIKFDVSFYVPCLNEQGNVGRTLETLAEVVAELQLSAEILVFDDGSTDDTAWEVLETKQHLAEIYPQLCIVLILLPESRGLGRNFFAGARRARGERYMLVNGDFSERAETLRDVLARLGEADVVSAIFADGDVRGPIRRGLSWLFTAAVNLVNGHSLRYYNGPTLHPRADVVRFASDCRGFAYQAELLTRQLDIGRQVLQVPMINRDRESGVSKALTLSNLRSVTRSLSAIARRKFEPPVLTDGPPDLPLVVLDRDGVINQETGELVLSPDSWRPIEGSLDAIARLCDHGFTVSVATNQSAIGRGLLEAEILERIHQRMRRAVNDAGGRIDRIVHCPHAPDTGCRCRKPKPGMLLDLARHAGVATGDLIFVGDAARDLEAARMAGAQGIRVRTGHGSKADSEAVVSDASGGDMRGGYEIFDDLAAVVDALIARYPVAPVSSISE